MARVTTKQAVAARKSWVERSEIWRDKISTAHIIKRLEKHSLGEVEMTATQVKAAQVLLDRVMPSLSASEVTRRNESINPHELIQSLSNSLSPEIMEKLKELYLPNNDSREEPAVTH